MKILLKITIGLSAILAVFAYILPANTALAEDEYAPPHFIFCIDTSRSMESFKDNITNLVSTYFYVTNCSYIKPETDVINFAYTFNFMQSENQSELIEAVSSLDYMGSTNIELSIQELNNYLIEYYDIDRENTELSPDDKEKLENLTLIYISDGIATLGSDGKVQIAGTNCIPYINIYQVVFDSAGIIMVNILDEDMENSYYPNNDIYMYTFVDYIAEKLNGQLGDYEGNRPVAVENQYSQVFYILDRKPEGIDKEDFIDDKNFIESTIISGEENTFINKSIAFQSKKYFYNSILASIHETTNEKLTYNENMTNYYVFNFVFPKPGFTISGTSSVYRNVDIEFNLKYDTSLFAFINSMDYSVKYEVKNVEDVTVNEGLIDDMTMPIIFKTDTAGIYHIEATLNYSDDSFDMDSPIERSISSENYCDFEVINHSPRLSETLIVDGQEKALGNFEEIFLELNNETTRNISQYFIDKDNDKLVFSIISENELVVKLDNNTLIIEGNKETNESVIIMAEDMQGGHEKFTFYVTVEAESNSVNPILISAIIFLVFVLVLLGIIIVYFVSKKRKQIR